MNATAILQGLKVLDISHQYSGALSASLLCDLGADVLAIEHPRGSPIRTMLPKKNDESLWWKVIQRGKRTITLNLSTEEGRELFLRLARDCDAIIENFRPGTLEKWRIGPADLEAAGIDVVLLRISGFGQTGPMRDLPGFGTVAEAISGFANLNGFPDGPPVFPSTTLGDGVAAVFGALGVLAALLGRRMRPTKGIEVVDVALFEGLFRLIPTQVAAYDQLGSIHERPGNFLGSHGVLRNLYLTRDQKYFCVSAVGDQAIARILEGADAGDLLKRLAAGALHDDPQRVEEFLTACDAHLASWSRARSYDDISLRMAESGAVFARVYNAADIVRDSQFLARGDLIRVEDLELGPILMQGVVPKFPARNHHVEAAGPSRGASNATVFKETLGLSEESICKLREKGVI